MSHDNNINIGSAGNGNTFNIEQHQVPDAPRIEYTIRDGSIENLSAAEVEKSVFAFWASASLPVLAIVADGLGVLSFLGIQTLWALVIVVPVALIGTLLTREKRKIADIPETPSLATYIDGRWVQRNPEGGFVLYRKTAPCIFPKCSGSVSIVPAPPRECHNHSLIGVCDVGGRRHTYTVDYNGIGYPQQFDWRPLEESKS